MLDAGPQRPCATTALQTSVVRVGNGSAVGSETEVGRMIPAAAAAARLDGIHQPSNARATRKRKTHPHPWTRRSETRQHLQVTFCIKSVSLRPRLCLRTLSTPLETQMGHTTKRTTPPRPTPAPAQLYSTPPSMRRCGAHTARAWSPSTMYTLLVLAPTSARVSRPHPSSSSQKRSGTLAESAASTVVPTSPSPSQNDSSA
jgi:hypothetical protein